MIVIDYQSRLPLYEQIAEKFQALILKGVLPPNTQLPSVRSLALELSLNPNTIQKAFALLEQQGYIYPVKGRGNFVADCREILVQQKAACLQELESRLKNMRELGLTWRECLGVLEEIFGKEENL